MKAMELMVGDWVYCEEQPTPENVTIQTIAEDGVWFDGPIYEGAASYDRIFPIPITPEILEKNGWTYNDVDKVFYPAQLRGELPYMVGINGVFRVRDFCEIRYVHELQHALRLCRINKEIIL